jgi:aspartyl-tRNA(Asn)/glutamyl-tRNA(Gln) amidotransferase subunit A
MLNIISGPDSRDPTCLRERPPDFVKAIETEGNLGKLRIAWSPDLQFAAVDPEVASMTKAAALSFEEFGCNIDEASPNIGDARESIWNPVALTDTYTAQADVLKHKSHLLTSYAKAGLEYGRGITGAEYSQALRELYRFQRQMEVFFNQYDLLLTPTLAVPAFPRHKRPEGVDLREINPQLFYPNEIAGRQVTPRHGFYPFTYPFNITGQPAASVPCGFSKEGLPIGLQIVGRIGEDATVLQASAAFEQAHPWSGHRPPLS